MYLAAGFCVVPQLSMGIEKRKNLDLNKKKRGSPQIAYIDLDWPIRKRNEFLC